MDMENTEPPVFSIIDNIPSTQYGCTLTGQFVPGSNKIALWAYKPITASTVDKPTVQKDEVKIHFLQFEFIFDDPILRSLIAESNSTFCTAQGLGKLGQSSKVDYIKVSATYRSIIRACIEKLRAAANMADADSERYQQYITIFYSIECLWHLAEILLSDKDNSSPIVLQLLEWIRFHFPSAEEMGADLLLLGHAANESETYWPALKQLILQGQVETAKVLLQLHPMAETSAFKMALEVLGAVPGMTAIGLLSVEKFRTQWQYFQTDIEGKLMTKILSIEPELEEIVKLVAGDRQVWDEAIRQSNDWYEYLPGYLFYTNPICKPYELNAFANDWLVRWSKLKSQDEDELDLKLIDHVVLNLMGNNMYKVIHFIQSIEPNQWFATHLVDLFYHSEQLQKVGENKIEECKQLRKTLVMEYGMLLMTRSGLYRFGIDYLESCGKEGQKALELLLPRVKTQNEKQTLRLLSIARNKGFPQIVQEICKVQAKKSFVNGRYGNALEWAIRSKDANCVTSIADHLLNEFSKTGKFSCPDVIANLESKIFISPRLVFLVKYFDFYQLYRKRDFILASQLLMDLLESNTVPEYFWPSLLIDSIPLLESKDIKILSKGTICIMKHLESDLIPLIEKRKKQIANNPNEPVEIIKDYRVENIEEVVKLLRLACARNLARALVPSKPA